MPWPYLVFLYLVGGVAIAAVSLAEPDGRPVFRNYREVATHAAFMALVWPLFIVVGLLGILFGKEQV